MSKGEATRDRIVQRAWQLASQEGLSGVSLGKLATELGLSKSGLFAHFGSKQELELEVLKAAAERFTEEVLKEAFKAPRGLPRVRKLFQYWLLWNNNPHMPGGCVFLAAASELDDSTGPQRDFVAGMQAELMATLAKAARLAVEAGQFRRDLDCERFAFELLGIILAAHHTRRLLRNPKADAHARAAFEALVGHSLASFVPERAP
jgi:AcrR family transcriptional regulator